MSETTALRIAGESSRSLPKRIGFTVATLEAATCPPGKDRITIYDRKAPGLALRVTEKGAKSFIFYRKVNGRPLKMKLGSFPEISIEQARNLVAGVHGEVAKGVDPMESRRSVRTSITLQELFDRYTKEHAELRATDRTRVTDKSRFDTCFGDWSARKIATLKPSHVRTKHAEIARKRGKVSANRAVQLLRRMFNWAKVEPNPAGKGVVDFFTEATRERFVQADELPRFFEALEACPNATVKDFIKVALFTGARRANVQSMAWAEISMERATWAIPSDKSKSGEAMTIHLAEPALEILRQRQNNDSPYVFPGRGKCGHLIEPKFAWKKILSVAKIKDLHLHDLRRTFGSFQAAGGASLSVIGKSLGHHDHATTQIYARLNLDPVRDSVNVAVGAIVAASTVATTAPMPAEDNARQGSD